MVRDVSTSEIETYQTTLLNNGKAPATADQIIGKTNIMINAAFNDGLVSGEVLRNFKNCKKMLKPGSDVRNRILSQDEFTALMSHASEHIKPIVACAYYTGMRRSVILSLTLNKVDLKNRIIQLDADITKDNEARKVPICKELLKILVSLPTRIQIKKRNDHVFQYRRKPVKNIKNGLINACKKAGIIYGRFVEGGFIFHDLRHTFNTNMRKAGVAESVIMEITGHSTREMFDRYNTIDEEDTRNAVSTIEDYFANVDLHVDLSKNIENITTA